MPGDKAFPRVLFLSAYKPFPKATVAEDNLDLFYYRNTLFQKAFQLKQQVSHHPLHLLAQNQPCPAVVLENPTWDTFTKEFRNGNFDVVAFTFVVPLTNRIHEMAKWIKEQRPDIDIILGGYGTVIFNENVGPESKLRQLATHVCTGEGVAFFRKYLAERWGVSATSKPLVQHFVSNKNYLFRSRINLFTNASFAASLGCTNRCSFCGTSAYFKGEKKALFTPEDLAKNIIQRFNQEKNCAGFVIFDENFLADRSAFLRFSGVLQTNASLYENGAFLTVFASLEAIRQYTIQELQLAGVGTIFIGIESCNEKIVAGEGLEKRGDGTYGRVIQALHDSGINSLGSLVIGWDGHTPENIHRDMEQFVALRPTFYQVVMLHPIPGTALWKRMRKENRIIPDYEYENDGVASCNMLYKNFTHSELRKLSLLTYKRLVQQDGPWPVRMLENAIAGYIHLCHTPHPLLEKRRKGYRKIATRLFPLSLCAFISFPRLWIRIRIWKMWLNAAGRFPLAFGLSLLATPVLLPVLYLLYWFGVMKFALSPEGDQPETIRRAYNHHS